MLTRQPLHYGTSHTPAPMGRESVSQAKVSIQIVPSSQKESCLSYSLDLDISSNQEPNGNCRAFQFFLKMYPTSVSSFRSPSHYAEDMAFQLLPHHTDHCPSGQGILSAPIQSKIKIL